MTNALAERPASNGKSLVTKESIRKLLMDRAKDIASIIPKTLTIEKLTQVSLIAIGGNPKLLEATPASLLKSIMTAAELGFESFGTLGHCYLVPFDRRVNNGGGWTKITECQLVIGYRGMIDLARRSGQIATISAHVVREGDFFDYEYGMQTRITHKPLLGSSRRKVIAAYAVAKLRDGSEQAEVMSFDEIEDIRQRSQTGRDKTDFRTGEKIIDPKTGEPERNKTSPWYTDYPEMARKTVVKRLFKYLPVSIECREDDWMNEDQTPPPALPPARETINRLLESRPLDAGQSFEPADDVQEQLDRQDEALNDAATQTQAEADVDAAGELMDEEPPQIDAYEEAVKDCDDRKKLLLSAAKEMGIGRADYEGWAFKHLNAKGMTLDSADAPTIAAMLRAIKTGRAVWATGTINS